MKAKHSVPALAGLAAFAISQTTAHAQTGAYIPKGTCDGLPRIDVGTPAGVCVGVVADVSTTDPDGAGKPETGFIFPRTVTELPDGRLVVVDMGGWAKLRGAVFLLTKGAGGRWTSKKIFKGLDQPHGSALGPDGKVYVAEVGKVFRFDPKVATPKRVDVVELEPHDGRHPLAAIVFDASGALYVNRGSASDNCEAKYKPDAVKNTCEDSDGTPGRLATGTIRRFALDFKSDKVTKSSTNHAVGLRNSMALAVHPTSGTFIQGENSRDRIDVADKALSDVDQPAEEINVITAGANYGWPYCYNQGVASPEFPRAKCDKYKAPALMLPAHVAPLGMAYYFGKMFPDWYKGKLLVGYHGYREYGQKIVAVPVDGGGRPTGDKPFEVINNWAKKDSGPQGAPVGVTVATDGAVLIVEDKNKVLLRMSYDKSKGSGIPTPGLSVNAATDTGLEERCKAMAARNADFTVIQRDIIDPQCAPCHGAAGGNPGGLRLAKCDDIGNAKRLLEHGPDKEPFVVPGEPRKSAFFLSVEGKTPGIPPMPAEGLSPEHLHLVEEWIAKGAVVPAGAVSGEGTAAAKNATVLKRKPVPSETLPPEERCSFPSGNVLAYAKKSAAAGNHFQLELKSADVTCPKMGGTVFVYGPHFTFSN